MSYRTHATSTDSIAVQYGTEAEAEEHLGYIPDDTENRNVLVLNDSGNQEAWVIVGSDEDFFALALGILRVVPPLDETGMGK